MAPVLIVIALLASAGDSPRMPEWDTSVNLPPDESLKSQCGIPKKPLAEAKVIEIAKRHLGNPKDILKITSDWGYSQCGWVVNVSYSPPGPGRHATVIVANSGKVKRVIGGM